MKFVVLETAYQCNQACQFCYNPWNATKTEQYPQASVLPKEDFKKILDKIKSWGADNIGFSGGEPLLNKDTFEIAEYSKQLGFKNALLTNGLLVEKFAEKIAETFDVVQISIHGTQKTHDQLTGIQGSLNQALKGNVTLMDYDVSVSAVIVVNRNNLNELHDTIGLAAAMDMRSVLVNRFLPGGRGIQNAKDLSLTEKELVEMLETIEKACDEFGIPPFVGTPTPLCLEGLRSYNFMLKEGCMAGKNLHCAIDPSGRMKVCNHSPTILGNCLTSDPKTLYETSDYVKGFMELRYTPEMCKGCSKVAVCKGGCRESSHVLFGNICAPDPIFGLKNNEKSNST